MTVAPAIFSKEELELINNLPEVVAAAARLSQQSSVLFTIPTSPFLIEKLAQHFQLDISSVDNIPCRWIKGDTPAHIDKGPSSFSNTYLIYLTDGQGTFRIGDDSYSMTAGTGFSFSEGVSHEVTGTNGTSRLLLGPMSEQGVPVGSGGSFVPVPGGTTIYLRDQSGITEYSTDQTTWNTAYFPFTIQNNDTSLGFVNVYFTTDITLSGTYDYFIANSDYIQFGSESLNADGTRPTINITASNYDGLIYNGASGTNGNNYIRVYNLILDGTGGSQQIGAGWVGHKYFGLGTTNNYIINCSSLGDINGGGILGDYAANVNLIGCSSSGDIAQPTAGGIVGTEANLIIINACWSTGDITADGAGGIVGANCIRCTISNCYSEGAISGTNAGGIIGSNAGTTSVNIQSCYSKGNITGANSAGICGSIAAFSGTNTVTINNCYSIGNIDNSGVNSTGGICGPLISGGGSFNIIIRHCYVTGNLLDNTKGFIIGNDTTINGSSSSYTLTTNFSEAGSPGGSPGNWIGLHANSVLTDTPNISFAIGNIWAATLGLDQPYELFLIGYSPYLLPVIESNQLVRSYSQTVVAGSSTQPAIKNDPTGNYRILAVALGDVSSRSLFTINGNTGAITVPSSVVPGSYSIYLRNVGSYNMTQFELTVTAAGAGGTSSSICCADTIQQNGLAYAQICDYKIGTRLIVERQQTRNLKFNGYSEYIKYKMAQMVKRN